MEDEDLNWVQFDEPVEVLTSISPECEVGNSEACPGFTEDHPEAKGKPVFCVHECHRKK